LNSIHDISSAESTPLATVTAAIGSVVSDTVIPEPIRQNALQAFGRLFTAAIDVPVSMLEGVAAEKRAEAHARARLIEASASQIASQLSIDPKFAEAASIRYAQRIVRQQVNLSRVAEVAAGELTVRAKVQVNPADEDKASTGSKIDEDWLNVFESEASDKSSEQMQMLFGKILAGEIRRPKSFSLKTLRLISHLDTQAAAIFKNLCSLAISPRVPNGQIFDVRVCSLGGNASSNSLATYGLSFDNLNVLHEYGLVISDYNSHMGYGYCIAQGNVVQIPLVFEGKEYGLVSKASTQTTPDFRIHGVSLSRAGRELFPIVEIEPNKKYHEAFRTYLDNSGFTLETISDAA
jgi:uncharacterized protein (UPF0147 family)